MVRQVINLILIKGVGKTNFMMKYLNNTFIEEHNHTQNDAECIKQIQVNGNEIEITIFDRAGNGKC
jgi:GTPase SAR1 family protein